MSKNQKSKELTSTQITILKISAVLTVISLIAIAIMYAKVKAYTGFGW